MNLKLAVLKNFVFDWEDTLLKTDNNIDSIGVHYVEVLLYCYIALVFVNLADLKKLL